MIFVFGDLIAVEAHLQNIEDESVECILRGGVVWGSMWKEVDSTQNE
jgi:hypothetical protein